MELNNRLRLPMSKAFRAELQVILLLVGFVVALIIRLSIGGVGLAQSPTAGLIFAVALLLLFVAAGGSPLKLSKRVLAIGLLGAAVVCLPALIKFLYSPASQLPAGSYLVWAATVSIVAFVEEAFLRGVLFDVLTKWRGETAAVLIAALAFAILHIPIYGWQVLPLDLVVGVWFGVLRLVAGTFVAPAIAHTVADLAVWWLV